MVYPPEPEFNPYGAPEHGHVHLSEVGPEKRNVEFAGFWIRFAARLIDELLIGAVLMVVMFLGIGMIYGLTGGKFDPEDETYSVLFAVAYLGWCAVCLITPVVYYTIMEASSWQASLGKKAIGLKVVNQSGYPISLGQSLGRNLGKLLSGMICSIGFIMAGFDDRKRALHDMMASTYVIRS